MEGLTKKENTSLRDYYRETKDTYAVSIFSKLAKCRRELAELIEALKQIRDNYDSAYTHKLIATKALKQMGIGEQHDTLNQ